MKKKVTKAKAKVEAPVVEECCTAEEACCKTNSKKITMYIFGAIVAVGIIVYLFM